MTSKTHLAVGLASALMLTVPIDPKMCCITIIGGLIGGVLPDIDILDDDYTDDAILGQFLAFGISAGILYLDRKYNFIGVYSDMVAGNWILKVLGIISFIVLYIIGLDQDHRKFTHSLVSMGLYSLSVWFIYPPLVESFLIGYISHIMIDLLNKKKVHIFSPINFGICFGICYANKLTDKILMIVGIIISIIFLFYGFCYNMYN